MIRPQLFYILILSMFFVSTPSFGQIHNSAGSTAGKAQIRLFEASLAAELTARWIPTDSGGVKPENIYILDSNIVADALPRTGGQNLIPVTMKQIDALARARGKVNYFRLVSLDAGPTTGKVVWHLLTASVDKTGKVSYVLGRTDEGEYTLTPKGWNEVSGVTTILIPHNRD